MTAIVLDLESKTATKKIKDNPQGSDTLKFTNINLDTLEKYNKIIAITSACFTSLDLSDNEFGNLHAADLGDIIAHIPASITSLNLSNNFLSSINSLGLAKALSRIPASVTSLDLSNSCLDSLSGIELARIFAAIPATVTKLNLSINSLGNLRAADLAKALSAIHSTVISLDVSDNYLCNLSDIGFKKAFAVLPASLISLNLSANHFGDLSISELTQNLSMFNVSIININLSNNELLINKSDKEKDELLCALIPYEQNGRILLAKNGETAFQRTLLPLLSMARQKRVPFDIAFSILALMLPRQSEYESAALIQTQVSKIFTSTQGFFTTVSKRSDSLKQDDEIEAKLLCN